MDLSFELCCGPGSAFCLGPSRGFVSASVDYQTLDVVTCTGKVLLALWYILKLSDSGPSNTCCRFLSSEDTWTCVVATFCKIFLSSNCDHVEFTLLK